MFSIVDWFIIILGILIRKVWVFLRNRSCLLLFEKKNIFQKTRLNKFSQIFFKIVFDIIIFFTENVAWQAHRKNIVVRHEQQELLNKDCIQEKSHVSLHIILCKCTYILQHFLIFSSKCCRTLRSIL